MSVAADLPRRLASEVTPQDAELASLRLATRVAIVQPLVLASALLLMHDAQVTLFAAFAVFGLLALANFGGEPMHRLGAYIVATLLGALIVAVGTAASAFAWTAALVTLVLVFVIEFAGVVGGYAAGARPPLLMALVLAASLPASPAASVPRITGWLIGGFAATVAALALWPHHERNLLRKSIAKALLRLAELVRVIRLESPSTEQLRSAHNSLDELRAAYVRTPYRAGGSSRRDRALAQLVTELRQTLYVAELAAQESGSNRPCIDEGNELASSVIDVFKASAEVLSGGLSPDLKSLEAARLAHRNALDLWAASQLRAGAPAEAVLSGLDADHRLRVVSYLALAIGVNATIAAGKQPQVTGMRIPFEAHLDGGFAATIRALIRTLQSHFTWSSSMLHTALRFAVTLALAVLVARVFGLARAFWVVLGAMSVLRSSAMATGRTTLEAMAGTLVGFAIAGFFTVVFAHNKPIMWAALPVAVFLATYAPSALSYIAGQAAFTILMMVLFNLLTPVGWTVGLVRIEDLAVGSLIGVVAGIFLWPRGARSDFAAALAALYRQLAIRLAEAFEAALGHGPVAGADRRAHFNAARDRAGEAFDQLLTERGAQYLRPETAGWMMATADQASVVADSLEVLAEMGYQAARCSEGAKQLEVQGIALVASWFMLSARLEGTPAARTVPVSNQDADEAALTCLRSWGGSDPRIGKAAIAAAVVREWIVQLDSIVMELEDPALEVAHGAAVPWWK